MKRRIIYLSFFLSLPLLHAQPVVAPSPDRTGSSLGSDLGPFNVTNSFETGYRFSEVGGDSNLYRSNVNYGNGLRLLGGSFAAISKDGHGPGFDTLTLTTHGLGNDPYGMATVRLEKNERYSYDMTWRRSDYFNSFLLNGGGGSLANTRRVMQDHDFRLSLTKWAKLGLGYSRNQDTGPFVSAYELYIGGLARSVLPLDKNTRQDYNACRLSGEFDFLGFRLTLTHAWDYFKDDTGLAVLSPDGSYPGPNPSVATAYRRSEPMHIRTPGWFGNLSKSRRLWAMNARMTYSKGDQNFIYSEDATGARQVASPACPNCGAGPVATVSTNMIGAARRPFAAGDLSFSLFPTKKLTVVSSTSAQSNRNDGTAQQLQLSSYAATKNIYYLSHFGSGRISDSLDVNYRVTKWLGLNSEYLYTDRWIDSIFTRAGTTKSAAHGALSNHLNAGTFGFRLKPIQPLSINVDSTIGRDSGAFTPTSTANYHTIRARVDYHLNHMRFGASYRQLYNLNAPRLFSYNTSHSRDISANGSFAIGGNWWLDLTYSKAHIDTLSDLFIELPLSDKVGAKITNVRGYNSSYLSNIHSVSLTAKTTIKERGTFYVGYNIVHDTGDGRAALDLGLQNPASAFLARAQTFPMTYQAPMARLSIRISPKLQWNGGWEFYRYNQQFAFFGYQPYYRAHTGYTSFTFTF